MGPEVEAFADVARQTQAVLPRQADVTDEADGIETGMSDSAWIHARNIASALVKPYGSRAGIDFESDREVDATPVIDATGLHRSHPPRDFGWH